MLKIITIWQSEFFKNDIQLRNDSFQRSEHEIKKVQCSFKRKELLGLAYGI